MATPKRKPEWLTQGEEHVRRLRARAVQGRAQLAAEREAAERRRARRRRFFFG